MTTNIKCYITYLLLFVASICYAHELDKNYPEHTPEHEAAKQTETMQREIDLTPDQVKLIYQINLKYARERQNSENRRANAMDRMKNKNHDYKKVLTQTQYEELEKRRLGIYSQEKKTSLNTNYRTLHFSSKSERDTTTQSQEKTSTPRSNSQPDSNTLLINEISTQQKPILRKTE